MMNRNNILQGDWDSFSIDKKNEEDDRMGDYWVSIATQGCGCCSDSYFELHDKNQTVELLKAWISIKEEELEGLKIKLSEVHLDED